MMMQVTLNTPLPAIFRLEVLSFNEPLYLALGIIQFIHLLRSPRNLLRRLVGPPGTFTELLSTRSWCPDSSARYVGPFSIKIGCEMSQIPRIGAFAYGPRKSGDFMQSTMTRAESRSLGSA